MPALLEVPLNRGAEYSEHGAEGELAGASPRLAAQCPLLSQLHAGLGEYVPLILNDVEGDLPPTCTPPAKLVRARFVSSMSWPKRAV